MQAKHELGRVVEFIDGVDAEAVAEGNPDVGAEAITRDGFDVVGFVEGRRGLGEEVAEGFADVDKACCA